MLSMSSDYDAVKCQTLLFFLEHLMIKGNVRSLHDLSCQFGTKGFTKEMRRIAGNSQSGLKKLLSQYPSIFTIKGELVKVTDYSENSRIPWSYEKRDYLTEAASYFKEKLLMYGTGTEVPVECLLGHRSQAPAEIRHVSGQHVQAFKEFLLKFPEMFKIQNDKVLLEQGDQMTRPSSVSFEDSMNPEVIEKLVMHVFKEVQLNGPMCVNDLFKILRNNENSFFLQNQNDLAVLLKMYSDRFLIKGGTVTAIKSYSVQQKRLMQRMTGVKEKLNTVLLQAVASNHRQSVSGENALLANFHLIVSPHECQVLVEKLLHSETPVVGLEMLNCVTEANNVAAFLLLITWEGIIYGFDFLLASHLLVEGKLGTLLESEHLVKVMHDCRSPSHIFQQQFHIQMQNVVDTQVLHAVVLQQHNGRQIHRVKAIGFLSLCAAHGIKAPAGQDIVQAALRHNPYLWAHRPLPGMVLEHVLQRLSTLVPTVYITLKSQLEDSSLPLVQELCQDQLDHFIDATKVKKRQQQRRLDIETRLLCQKLEAAPDDQPLVLSNREVRLVRHIPLGPQELNKLKLSARVWMKIERFLNSSFTGNNPQDSEPEENQDSSLESSTTTHEMSSVGTSPTQQDAATQTISTGDIVMLQTHLADDQ